MTTFRSEEMLVGLVALALLPFLAHRVLWGLREGRVPLYRTYFHREEGSAKFAFLLGVHAISFFLVAAIAADLLFNLGLRDAL